MDDKERAVIAIYCDGPTACEFHVARGLDTPCGPGLSAQPCKWHERYGLDAYHLLRFDTGEYEWAPLYTAMIDGRSFVVKRGGLQHLAGDRLLTEGAPTRREFLERMAQRTRSRYQWRCRKCRFDVPAADPHTVHSVFDEWVAQGFIELPLRHLKARLAARR